MIFSFLRKPLILAISIVSLFAGKQMSAQTTLASGGLLFTGYHGYPVLPAVDEFSFLLMTSVSNGTTINFTDNGWNASILQLTTTESTISWTASGNIPAYTEVYISGLTAYINGVPNGVVNNLANASTGLNLSNSGDQILAYQGPAPVPNPALIISGIHMNFEVGPPMTTASTWDQIVMASTRSAIPPGITTYTNAMFFNTETDNAKFNSSVLPQPNASALIAALNNPANWTQSDGVSITLPSGGTSWIGTPMTLTMSSTNVSCNGGANGTSTVSVAGGQSPFTFSWAPSGGTNSTATGRPAGNYTVTVTDATSSTATGTVTITQPAAFSVSTAQANVSCYGGSNGAAAVSVSGATPPYQYVWSPSGGTNATASGRPAGNYTITITDNNGCTTTRSFTITQPSSPVSGTTVVTNVACFGGNTGAINLTPGGGTSPYSFNWGGGITTEDRTNLTAGTYTVNITDNNGCPSTVTTTVTQPASTVSGTTVVTNVACFGGSNGAINLTPNGGTGPYTFNWLPSGPTTEDRTGLVAGTYTVQITDANGCTGTVTATVTQPNAPVSGNTVVTNVACFGGSNGAINLTPNGGNGPYTFNWLPSGPTTEDRTGLVAGTYSVVITDVNGCTGTVTASVTQPNAPVSGTTVVTNVACFGGNTGAINLTPNGGTGPYTFNWLPSGPTTEDRTGLAAGTYTVIITDNNACTGTVTVSVTQPTSPVSGTTVVTNVACFGGNTGAINLTPNGGTGPYTFNWLPSGPTTEDRTGLAAGTYTVIITDNNACTGTVTISVTQPTSPVSGSTVVTNVACFGGSNGAINLTPNGGTGPYTFNWLPSGPTTEDRTGLVAGTYTVQITDVNGCTGTVTASVTQPNAPVSGTTVVTNVACFGGNTGAINLTPNGGTGPYTFNWLPSGPTTEDRTGLAAGTYTVIITDNNACTGTVTVSVTQPTSPVSGTTVVTNVACFGGSNGAINLTPNGGTGPYTFNWLPSGPTTEDRTGLVAGTYTVQITDVNGCTGTVTASVTQPNAPVSGTTVVTNVACFGGNTGAINLTPNGGNGPYTFNWLPSGPTTEDRTGLAAGTYTVIITDNNACTGTVTVSVTQPTSPVSGTTVVTNVACFGGSNGAINLTPNGGTGTYTFNWLPSGPTTEDRTGLAAGTYTVQITDVNGCTGTVTASVTQPNAPVSGTTVVTNVACFGNNTGAINLTPAGGTPGYTFNWGGGITTEDRTVLAAGSYTVVITDANGCTGTLTASVTQPAVITGDTTAVACGSFTWYGTTHIISGTDTHTFTSVNGCDSIVTLHLTIKNSTSSTLNITACNSYTLNSTPYNASGTYTQMIPNAAGCDSTITLNLTINNSTASTLNITACNSYTLNTSTYTTSGTYTQVISNAAGCDSTITLNLTLNNSSASTLNVTACDSYVLNSTTYTSSGTFIQNITNTAGCDSTITLNLIIKNSTASSLSATACNSYTLNASTYTSSGVYTQVIPNIAGCDSTITLNLVINNSTTSTLSETACNSYTLNAATYTSSGIYTQVLTNAAGCDSTITLNLTINNATASTLNVTACNSYTLNTSTYTASGTYVQTIQNAAGCDSTITLNLTINNSSASSLTEVACGSFTLNSITYTTSGLFTQTLTNTAGCDSVITLDLTINANPVITFTVMDTVCVDAGVIGLTASPAGGVFAGNGVTGVDFNPSVAGVGTHTLAYTYTDAVTGCSNMETAAIYVDVCAKIRETASGSLRIYPNPFSQTFVVEGLFNDDFIEIYNAVGEIVKRIENISGDNLTLETGELGNGVYFLSVTGTSGRAVTRIVKQQ